jgi:hypothetical protein
VSLIWCRFFVLAEIYSIGQVLIFVIGYKKIKHNCPIYYCFLVEIFLKFEEENLCKKNFGQNGVVKIGPCVPLVNPVPTANEGEPQH